MHDTSTRMTYLRILLQWNRTEAQLFGALMTIATVITVHAVKILVKAKMRKGIYGWTVDTTDLLPLMHLAMHLLAEGRLSVADIATRLGFEDASTFYRAFRKWTGSAPGAWRSAQQVAVLAG